MKLLLTLAFLITTNAFAVDICSETSTWDFAEALKAEGIRPSKIAKNHRRFTFTEKQMIHLTVTLQDYLNGTSRDEALAIFEDASDAGEIKYYTIQGKQYALVHYWPGDNEYGAYFALTRNSFKLIASIEDGDIYCK